MLAGSAWATKSTVGLGAGIVPDYEGSDDTEAAPMFMFTHRYDSSGFVSLMRPNMKVNLLANKQYSLGPVLNVRQGRDDVDNNRVDAMKDVDSAFEAGIFGAVDVNDLLLGLELLSDVSDEHEGFTAQATAGYRMKTMPDLVITPGAFITYADSDYMKSFFSVNVSNHGNNGLPDFSASSSFKDVGIKVSAHYTPWEHWGIMGVFAFKALLGDAKDSPVVDMEGDDKQITLGVMATYRWEN
jgi:outer membrane protein